MVHPGDDRAERHDVPMNMPLLAGYLHGGQARVWPPSRHDQSEPSERVVILKVELSASVSAALALLALVLVVPYPVLLDTGYSGIFIPVQNAPENTFGLAASSGLLDGINVTMWYCIGAMSGDVCRVVNGIH